MRVLVLLLVLLCGCGSVTESDQLLNNKPFKVAESDGVTVWKVRGSTNGGKAWVYYTTPSGQVLE